MQKLLYQELSGRWTLVRLSWQLRAKIPALSVTLVMLLLGASGWCESPPAQELRRATDVLNPKADSSATLKIREWNNAETSQEGEYKALFLGQDSLLLRKIFPEKDRGRNILLLKNRLWVALPSARRPVQLSTEQRWTSDAFFADLTRANFSRDYTVSRRVVEDNPVSLHFYLQAKQKDVPYANVELWLDKLSKKPLRAQFSTGSRALVKECVYTSFERVAGEERPTRLLFSDPAHRNWRAELIFTHWVAARAERKLFDPGALGKDESVTAPVHLMVEIQPSRKTDHERGEMAFVPEGNFIMGRDNGFPDEQPAHAMSVKAFWIDRTEVTTGQYKRFLSARGYSLPPRPMSPSMPQDYFTNSAYDSFPVVEVTWARAGDYCHWAGKRLPSEAEWEKAARGADQRLYPWGNQWDSSAANSRESEVSSTPHSTQHFTYRVGALPLNSSPYGLLDMAGNVWEWVQDWYVAYPGNTMSNEAYGEQYKVVRGGSWVSNSLSLLTVARDFAPPGFGYDSIGFRCAKSANN